VKKMIAIASAIALGAALPVLGCDYPDEGTMPLRRALTRVQMLPETEAWQQGRRDAGELVQYRLLLAKEYIFRGKCHWTVETTANGNLWRRFYVSPDGKSVLRAGSDARLY
jgi:hypothetical protein